MGHGSLLRGEGPCFGRHKPSYHGPFLFPILSAHNSVHYRDKYLPSCLVYLKNEGRVFHFVCALDTIERKVWIVTAYQPDPQEWDIDYKKRRNT